MIQLQYRIPKGMKVTAADVEAWRRAYIEGRKVPGIRIKAVDWRYGGSSAQIRARLRKGFTSRVAGIVEEYAGPGLVMCDYDRKNVKPLMRLWAVSRMMGIHPKFTQLRRTRRGWHMLVQFRETFNALETVALQAILGSDAFRETYNLVRVRSKRARDGRWNLLFRQKVR